MLNLNNLELLNNHINYLKSKLNNENIFIVGGSIRDILLGIQTDELDIDLTLAGDPQDVFANINDQNISIFKTDKFGTITILPKENELNKIYNKIPENYELKYEITPLREELGYTDFRHPDQINWTDSIISDSIRRDFTINAIYYYLTNFKLEFDNISDEIKSIDKFTKKLKDKGHIFVKNTNTLILQDQTTIENIFPNGKLNRNNLEVLLQNSEIHLLEGVKDNESNINILIDPQFGINNFVIRKIKAVNNPDNRFAEDALRIIRAIRQLNILNQKIEKTSNPEKDPALYFDIENDTWDSMIKHGSLIKNIAKERIKDEITKVFKYNDPFSFIVLIDKIDILKYIFPSLHLTKNIDQPIRYHPFDVYNHTILTLYELQKINTNYLVKLGMLYHDVGKPKQYALSQEMIDKGEPLQISGTELHHPAIGEIMSREDFNKLGFSKKEIDEIVFYVKQHMLIGQLLQSNQENIEKKIKRRLGEYGYERFNNLIDITIGDRLGHYNPIQPPELAKVYWFRDILEKVYQKQGEFKTKDLDINGNDIMKKFDIRPGKQIGEILNKVYRWVVEDTQARNQKNIIIEYIKDNILIN